MRMDEVFDNPLHLTRNKQEELTLAPYLNSIEVYDSVDFKSDIRFFLFKHQNFWEVHFGDKETDYSPEILGKYKGADASRIIATAIKLITEKFHQKRTPIRIFGPTEKTTRLYLKIAEKFLPDNARIDEVKNFRGIDGDVYPLAIVIRQSNGTFNPKTFYEHAPLPYRDWETDRKSVV